ncbi:uncharacterized protein LOC118455972, partial [Neolamprologus brichardi]|uniref:uncharacterized protein LOC118455972 n=1 Tax=Neolamprologus brichardi TaxID=32507 RepID=UPI001643C34A
SLSVSPNLQQVFRGSSSVSLSCVDDGQTADGWTVKRSRGGLTEDCGAAAGFGRVHGSSCVLDRSVSSGGSYFCENSSGQQSDEVSISVSSTDSQMFILEIPALPVRTGSNMTLRCRQRNGGTVRAYFFINGSHVGSESKSELIITNVQQSDEGLYSCSTDTFGESHQSFLRVRVYELQTVEVTPGVKRVMLPFKTTAELLEDVRVDWRRSDLEDVKVLVYENSQKKHEEQHQGYKGRTR